jgi:hypothetical protein
VSWHTTGPGGLRYRFGNVVAVARSSRLGQLSVVPRLTVLDEAGEVVEMDDLEFLGDLQRAIEASDLPWTHLELHDDAGSSGDALAVTHDVNRALTLWDLGEQVAGHVASVFHVLAAAGAEPSAVSQLRLGLDTEWTLPAADVGALVDWLNVPFGASAPLSPTALADGRLDGDYRPPPALEAVFDRLSTEDPARHLAAHALAHAALAGKDVWLSQPDDDHTALIWDRALDSNRDAGGAVLIRPADYPFLDLLAAAFGVPASGRERIYFVAGPDTDLPEEDEVTPEEEAAGMAFAGYLASLLEYWALDRLVPPGADSTVCGFHAGGTLAAITEAFTAAGVPVHPLDALLAGDREPFQHLAERARLAAMLETADADDRAVYAYILDGGPIPSFPSEDVAAGLLVLLEKVDLVGPERERLADVLRVAADAAAAGAAASDEADPTA